MNEIQEKDKNIAKNAIKVYLQHFTMLERSEILENLVCELDQEGIIKIDYVEIY